MNIFDNKNRLETFEYPYNSTLYYNKKFSWLIPDIEKL